MKKISPGVGKGGPMAPFFNLETEIERNGPVGPGKEQ